MGNIAARFVVYYRDLPKAILDIVSTDGRMSISKDGIKKTGDQKVARLTVSMESIDATSDKKRSKLMNSLLKRLACSSEIITFKERS